MTEGADTALSKHAHHKCCPVINRARGEGGVKQGRGGKEEAHRKGDKGAGGRMRGGRMSTIGEVLYGMRYNLKGKAKSGAKKEMIG